MQNIADALTASKLLLNHNLRMQTGSILTGKIPLLNAISLTALFFRKQLQLLSDGCSAQALVAAAREIGLEVSADKTKYMVMSGDQNAGRIHSVRMDNSTFERVEEFKYLETTLTNQNAIQEEIKSILRSENACYYSASNL